MFQKNVAPERTLSKFAQSCYVHVVTASRRGGNEQNRTNMMTWLSAQIDPPPESNFMAPGAAGPLSFFFPSTRGVSRVDLFLFFFAGRGPFSDDLRIRVGGIPFSHPIFRRGFTGGRRYLLRVSAGGRFPYPMLINRRPGHQLCIIASSATRKGFC